MITNTLNINSDKRVFVVGDIHGEISKLNNKLSKIGFDKDRDILIAVGDLVDRGEDSVSCLELTLEPWFHSVRGNHEQMMFDAIKHKDQDSVYHWFANGGNWFFEIDDTDKMHVEEICKRLSVEMPHVIELHYQDEVYVICHANYPSDSYPDSVSSHDVIWDRSRIDNIKKHHKATEIKGADHFIFGHTPTKEAITVLNCSWIDTGACFGKEITVLQLGG